VRRSVDGVLRQRSRRRERREVGDWARCAPSLLHLRRAPPLHLHPHDPQSVTPAAAKAKDERQGGGRIQALPPPAVEFRLRASVPTPAPAPAPAPAPRQARTPACPARSEPGAANEKEGWGAYHPHPHPHPHAPRHRSRLGHGGVCHRSRTCSTPQCGLAPPCSPVRVRSTDARREAFAKCLPSGEEGHAHARRRLRSDQGAIKGSKEKTRTKEKGEVAIRGGHTIRRDRAAPNGSRCVWSS
jgi:hypothetical protein